MLSSTIIKRKQWSLVGLFVAAAVTAVLFGAASVAKADTAMPSSHVDNVINGVIYYSGTVPIVSGWAIDPAWPNVSAPQIPVTANVTWYKKPAICALCTPGVVGQATWTQIADQYRSELLNTAAGPYHGFAFTLIPPSGVTYTSVKVCLSQTGYYGTTSLGCYSVVYQQIV